MTDASPVTVELVERPGELSAVATACSRAEAVAVDVEADGLYAYRNKLCTMQLAWPEGERTVIAIVDTLRVDIAPLAAMLAAGGPVKVLHDLSFDARMLADAGAPLARVRDTSVAARLLGFRATGLASMAESELGIPLDKRFQQHDWSRRPITPEQLEYLAGDVRHLLALDARLATRAEELGITAEIADECAYKLETALGPPRDARPGYVRVKGVATLDAPGRAVLRRLCEAREKIAQASDVPPFKIVGTEPLLELARKRPLSTSALRAVKGLSSGYVARHLPALLRAIEEGLRDGDIPEGDRVHFQRPEVDRALVAARRARETQLSAWRRAEAARRGVDEQAVLPGHCAQGLLDAMTAAAPGALGLDVAIAAIPGVGAARLERYAAIWVALGAEPPPLPAARAEAATAAPAPEPSGEPS